MQFTRKFLSQKLTAGVENLVSETPLAEGVSEGVVDTVAIPSVDPVDPAAVVVEPPVADAPDIAPVVPAVEAADGDAADAEPAAAEGEAEPATDETPAADAEPTSEGEADAEPEAEADAAAEPETTEEPAADPVAEDTPVEPDAEPMADVTDPIAAEDTPIVDEAPVEAELVVEASAEPVVLVDEYADSVVELNTAEAETDEAEADVNSLDEITEGLESIRAEMQKTKLMGGMRGTEFKLARIGIESYTARIPNFQGTVTPSMESANFGVTTGRILATNAGVEALDDTLKNVYEIAKKALAALWEMISKFVTKLFDYLERMKSRLEKAQAAVKAINGTPKDSSVELSNEQLAAICNGNTVAKAADYLKSSAKFFDEVITDKMSPGGWFGRGIVMIYTQCAFKLFEAKDQEATDAAHAYIEKVGNEFLERLGQAFEKTEFESDRVSFDGPKLIGGSTLKLIFSSGDTFIDKIAGSGVFVGKDDQNAPDKAATLSVTEMEKMLSGVSDVIEAIEKHRRSWFGRANTPESVWMAEANTAASKIDSLVANVFTSDPRTKKFVNARPKIIRICTVGPTRVLAALRAGADAALTYVEKSAAQYGSNLPATTKPN